MDDRIECLKWYAVYLLNKHYREEIVLGEIYTQGKRKFGMSKAELDPVADWVMALED